MRPVPGTLSLTSGIQARRADGAITLFIHGGEAFQLVLHPVQGMTSAGWLVMGFRLDEDMATALSALIRSDTHFEVLAGEGEGTGLVGSEGLRRASTLYEGEGGRIQLVVERSFEALLADYQAIKRQLAIILAISLALMLVAASLIARGVSLPLLRLVGAAKSVGRGEPLDLDRLPDRENLACCPRPC